MKSKARHLQFSRELPSTLTVVNLESGCPRLSIARLNPGSKQ